jgi:nucleotidyltransferase/DNA polymerase involved in DNA repair
MKHGSLASGQGWLVSSPSHPRPVINIFSGFIAKKLCPELIFVPNRFSRYMEKSGQIMVIFRRYDSDMCPGGCDEAYLKSVYNYFSGITPS